MEQSVQRLLNRNFFDSYSCLLPPDDTLKPSALLDAVSTVGDIWQCLELVHWFGAPSVCDQIRHSPLYSSEDKKRTAVLQYCLQTLPRVSWGRIAGELWFVEEHTALETIRQLLPRNAGEYEITYMHLYTIIIYTLQTVLLTSRMLGT